jgi:hypothetical protein
VLARTRRRWADVELLRGRGAAGGRRDVGDLPELPASIQPAHVLHESLSVFVLAELPGRQVTLIHEDDALGTPSAKVSEDLGAARGCRVGYVGGIHCRPVSGTALNFARLLIFCGAAAGVPSETGRAGERPAHPDYERHPTRRLGLTIVRGGPP